MIRRTFLRNTAIGMGAVAGASLAGLSTELLKAKGEADPELTSESGTRQEVGRPVCVVSIGFRYTAPLEEITKRVNDEGSQGADIIVLPELCRGQDQASEEPLHGPTITAMSALAKRHKTYIAVPIDRRDGAKRLNSVVLLDRAGQVVCIYDKVFPYWSEYVGAHVKVNKFKQRPVRGGENETQPVVVGLRSAVGRRATLRRR